MKAASVLLLLATLFASTATWAGPAFQIDDPESIVFKNREIYAFATADGRPVEMDTAGPAAEFQPGRAPERSPTHHRSSRGYATLDQSEFRPASGSAPAANRHIRHV